MDGGYLGQSVLGCGAQCDFVSGDVGRGSGVWRGVPAVLGFCGGVGDAVGGVSDGMRRGGGDGCWVDRFVRRVRSWTISILAEWL